MSETLRSRPSSSARERAGLEPITLPRLPAAPLVSVLVTNYNYGRFLEAALESVRRQTYPAFEVVVCDDGSTDDSVAVVRSFVARDDRFALVRHERSRGQAAAFNTAFGQARGDVVCLLDADDMFAEQKIDVVVRILTQHRVGAVVHRLMMVDDRGPVQQIPTFTRFESGWIAPRVLERGGRWRWMPTSAVAMHRAVADVIFPMPEDGFITSADTYFLMLMPLLTPIASIERVEGVYRRHGGNAFARSRVELDSIARFAENARLSVAQVNIRLTALGAPGVALNVEENLRYREALLQLALLSTGTPLRSLVAAFLAFVPVVLRDDLYGVLQKAWAVVMYGVAVVLPPSTRQAWLSVSLSPSRAKEAVRRLLGPRRSNG